MVKWATLLDAGDSFSSGYRLARRAGRGLILWAGNRSAVCGGDCIERQPQRTEGGRSAFSRHMTPSNESDATNPWMPDRLSGGLCDTHARDCGSGEHLPRSARFAGSYPRSPSYRSEKESPAEATPALTPAWQDYHVAYVS